MGWLLLWAKFLLAIRLFGLANALLWLAQRFGAVVFIFTNEPTILFRR